jgi:hypothetical protein
VWVVKASVALLAIATSTIFVSAYAPRAKTLAATCSIALSATLAYIPYAFAIYEVLGKFYAPEPTELASIAFCALIAFCVAWVHARLRPNDSLERASEG